jgi:hypothetical protein
MPVEVEECDGRVSWYPSRDIAPVVFDESVPPIAGPLTP